MLKHIQEHRHRPFGLLHKGIYMILQELHSASSNQLAASLHSEAPSGELWKLLAPPWHCLSAALFNPYHRFALTTSLIT